MTRLGPLLLFRPRRRRPLRVELSLQILQELLDEGAVRRVRLLAQVALKEKDRALLVAEHAMALADVEQEGRRRQRLVRLAVELERLVEVTDVVLDGRTARQGLGLVERCLRPGGGGEGDARGENREASRDAKDTARSGHLHSNGLMTPD
jgi:hypothetical protein